MKGLGLLYTILTIAISFTFDLWAGTVFVLAPLATTVGGAVMRVASERGDTLICIFLGGGLIGGGWAVGEWMQLRVDLFDMEFESGWWRLGGAAIGFAGGPEAVV
ncbi:MAG TPA: hypothetical protein VF782_05470 [Allosphingosinicella sp.]|jgi:hypothetical protein